MSKTEALLDAAETGTHGAKADVPVPTPPMAESPWRHGSWAGRWGLALAYYVSIAVFSFGMLYASGVPLLIVSIMQQTGTLPSLANGTVFWHLMFPVHAGDFSATIPASGTNGTSAANGTGVGVVDLLGANYVVIAVVSSERREP